MGTDRQKFQAEIGGRKINLEINRGSVSIDDRRADYSHENVSERHVSLLVDGRSFPAVVLPEGDSRYRVYVGGRDYEIELKDERDLLLERFGLADTSESSLRSIRAPMPGLVLSVSVEPGQEVGKGAGLVVLEAMKMENELRAERDGVVKTVHVAAGDAVGKNDLLLELE